MVKFAALIHDNLGLNTPKCFMLNYCAIVKTGLDGVFIFLMIVAKTSNSAFVKIYKVANFNMFPPRLRLAISHKCGLMPLHYKSCQTFTLFFFSCYGFEEIFCKILFTMHNI